MTSHAPSQRPFRSGRSFRSKPITQTPPVQSSPGIDDLIIWAVLVRSVGLVEALWRCCADPIRLALIAGATASRAAERDMLYSAEYLEHAELYVTWACAVLGQVPLTTGLKP